MNTNLIFDEKLVHKKLSCKFAALLAYGVTGNTSDFGSEESRFEP